MTNREKNNILRQLIQAAEYSRSLRAKSQFGDYYEGKYNALIEAIEIVRKYPVTEPIDQFCPCGNPLDDNPTRPEGICQECR